MLAIHCSICGREFSPGVNGGMCSRCGNFVCLGCLPAGASIGLLFRATREEAQARIVCSRCLPEAEPACPACGYVLYYARNSRCPDCGRPFRVSELNMTLAAIGPKGILYPKRCTGTPPREPQ